MHTSTTQEPLPENASAPSPADVLLAYLGKSRIVQAVIRDLMNILKDANVRADERQWAEKALSDALFRPRPARSCESAHNSELLGLREVHVRMAEQERLFAENLLRLLEKANVSQSELARRVGIQPSAISMMLSRHCRPQQRTVQKIAQALDAELDELWPAKAS